MFDDARDARLQIPTEPEPASPTHLAPAALVPPGPVQARRRLYVSVRWKFFMAICAGTLWAAFSLFAARPWLADLSGLVGAVAAHLVIFGIAIIPGFMNAFLVVSLLLDRRPPVRAASGALPGISILVAAYN
jgi:biofilm PGA synthesis N-glycosyltransferase PgaC